MELTCLALKITSLKFLECSFFYVGVYRTLYELFKGFIFHEGSVHIYRKQAASLAEPMPMQIAQDKRNVDRLLTYIVREDFITRYVPWLFFQTLTSLPRNIHTCKKQCFLKLQCFNVNLR